jgi:catecholate siderophore receptor
VLIDAMASYTVNRQISLRLNATNLADEDYVDRFGGGHYVPGPGRTVSLTANFGF